MNLISWLGLAFVAVLVIGGLLVLLKTMREIRHSGMEEDAQRWWGLLLGFSPLAGLFAYRKRDELFGHGNERK